MELRKFGCERYRGYADPTEMELAPLTILVGANNSGKTALAQAIQLLAGGLVPSGMESPEPLPLVSGGIRHGLAFEDLVTGRAAHGRLRLSAELTDGSDELSFSATVGNVSVTSYFDTGSTVDTPLSTLRAERQISRWHLASNGRAITLDREGYDRHSNYGVRVEGTEQASRPVKWRGLVPGRPDELVDWLGPGVDALRSWALGVRHLKSPRRFRSAALLMPEEATVRLGPAGEHTPFVLAVDDRLRQSVRGWYRNVFGVGVDIAAQGRYFDLVVDAPARDAGVRLAQSGRGLAHVLPVVVTALTARTAGPGVDVIEHPEAELHPAAHADVAELLLGNLAGPARPTIIETHSEMVLLRARRWIAEGRLSSKDVLVYWIDAEPGRGSTVRKIEIDEYGDLDHWPDGVFIEDYEEVMAIRRANRSKARAR